MSQPASLPVDDSLAPLQKQRRLVDQVAESLRERIFSGRIEPGTKLIQEELAGQLGISRTPLREAFRMLERDGLVNASYRSNTVIVAAFTDKDIAEFYQIREVLDGLAARLTAERKLEASALTHLARRITEMSNAVRPFDTARWVEAHVAFHLGIVEASGNSRLHQHESIIRISAQMLYGRLASNVERMQRSNEEHQMILDGIVAGDPEAAEEKARQHIRRALDVWVARANTNEGSAG